MTNTMKYSSLLGILLLMFSFNACNKGPENVEETTIAKTGEESIALSDEQIQFAGIELGKPTNRSVANYVECTGFIDVPPANLRSVHSPVMGFVQMVRHLPGEYVRKGELLTSIAHPELVRLQRNFLESASRQAFLKRDMERKMELEQADASSRKAYEQALTEYEVEKAHYNGLKSELKLIGINAEEVENTGQVQESIRLYAPVNGYITKMEVNPGKLVEPNALLYELVDNSHLHLELQVYAKDLAHIKEGQTVMAQLPGSEQYLKGEVHLIGKAMDMENKTVSIHAHLDEEPQGLAIGTYLQASIRTDAAEVATVPESAIVRSGNQSYVFVKESDGFKKRLVQTGRTEGGFVEVQGLELSEGQQIALKGAYYINGTE
ncbi:MAG: efflux RND transporter periplasmic adaptor subunit [Lewinellaceae bacterium]|nr:efflux RND transporter periplasmic adaptor subunit [Lewinellaceae bacterium]